MSKEIKKLDNLNDLPFPPEILENIKLELEKDPDFKSLSNETKSSMLMIASTKITQYSTPFPPPPLLAEMERALPGAGELILKSYLKEQDHGIYMDTKRIDFDQAYRLRGMSSALIFSLAALFTSYKVAELGHPWAGGIIAGGVLVSIVGAFIYGENKKKSSKDKGEIILPNKPPPKPKKK